MKQKKITDCKQKDRSKSIGYVNPSRPNPGQREFLLNFYFHTSL